MRTTHKKFLAIVWAVLFDVLISKKVVSPSERTKSLSSALTMTVATDKLAHWPLRVIEFGFDTQYGAGLKHQAADDLSQFKTGEGNTKLLEDKIPVGVIFDQRQTRIENSGDDSDEDNSDNQ